MSGEPFDEAAEVEEHRDANRARRSMGVIMLAVLALGGIGAILASTVLNNTAASMPTIENPPTPALDSALLRAIVPSIVTVRCVVATAVGSAGAEEAAGTGIVIGADNEVLTNNHVIEDATSITVSLSGTGARYKARVLGVDASADVALLKVLRAPKLAAVPIDTAPAVPGETVVAIGNANGLGRLVPAAGMITGVSKTITATDAGGVSASAETLRDLIETNAAVQEGDSGGPLVDIHGSVIGIDTAAASVQDGARSAGFAIPIATALRIAREIVDRHGSSTVVLGESAFLGVAEQRTPLNSSAIADDPRGVIVPLVVRQSPAQRAGLVSGDIITALDGKPVHSWKAMQSMIAQMHPGQTLALSYLTEVGEARRVQLHLGGIPR
jgi:S1-C subfamily serine protease